MCGGKIGWNRGGGMDKQSYPQGASICQSMHMWTEFFVCDFKGGRMRGSPLWHWPPLSFMFHIWHDYKNRAKIHRHTNPHLTKNLATALSPFQWLDSPRSLDGLRDTVTVSRDPRRQPWDKALIITLCTPRWKAGGGVTLWWGERSGREAIDLRLIVEMEEYPHLPQWPLIRTGYNTHTKNAYTHTYTQLSMLLRRTVLSSVITLLPLWHGEIGAIWTPL